MKGEPTTIWLQRGEGCDCPDFDTMVRKHGDEVTWCDQRVEADDIGPFVREDVLKRENVELKERLADYDNATRAAMDPCPDEQHCTCVPLLKARIAVLEGAGKAVVEKSKGVPPAYQPFLKAMADLADVLEGTKEEPR